MRHLFLVGEAGLADGGIVLQDAGLQHAEVQEQRLEVVWAS